MRPRLRGRVGSARENRQISGLIARRRPPTPTCICMTQRLGLHARSEPYPCLGSFARSRHATVLCQVDSPCPDSGRARGVYPRPWASAAVDIGIIQPISRTMFRRLRGGWSSLAGRSLLLQVNTEFPCSVSALRLVQVA